MKGKGSLTMPIDSNYGYDPQQFTQQPAPAGQLPVRKVAIALCVVATLIALWVVISAVMARSSLGTLAIQVSDPKAELTVSRANVADERLGTGNRDIRLKPGTYTVAAKAGDRQAAKTVTITEGQQTQATLTLPPAVAVDTVTQGSASDLYLDDGTLYYLNTGSNTASSHRIGDSAGRPYNTSIYPVSSLQWITPTSYYALEAQSWRYVQGGDVREFRSGDHVPASPEAISFNASGGYAFVSDRNSIIIGKGPTGQALDAGGARGQDRLSIAPNGDVLLFTTNAARANDKPRVFRGGKLNDLKADVSGIRYAAWSPDSNRIAYVTDGGFYVLDITGAAPKLVITARPTNAFSPVWISNDTFIFAHDQTIWKYSLKSDSSVKVAAFDGEMTAPRPFYLAADGQSVYFGTNRSGDGKGGAIYRTYPNYNELTAAQQDQLKRAAPAPAVATSYQGFEALLNIGVSNSQLTTTTYAVGQYLKTAKLQVKQASVLGGSVTSLPRNIGDDISAATFTLRLDGTSYGARLNYEGLGSIRLFIYDSGGKQLYDSGELERS